MPAAACTLDVANAIAVRCTTADDSVATACAAGFYLAADDTCLGMDAAVRLLHWKTIFSFPTTRALV
jgi:hypothetical protein